MSSAKENAAVILPLFDVYLGTVAGSIIHFNPGKNNKTIHLRNDERAEITSLAWGRTRQEVLIGYKTGKAQIYNFKSEKSVRIPAQEKSHIVGVVPFKNDVIFATNKGNLYHWSDDKISPYLTNVDDNKTLEKIVANPYINHNNQLAIGGVNYDVKIIDMATKKPIFQGKADRHDELELAQPISINSLCFFDRQIVEYDIATVTKQGQIRIYDTRAQRRPIKIYKSPDAVYTTICPCNVQYQICVGTTKGFLQVMDLRNDIKIKKTFRGYMGGLTDVSCDDECSIVASVCLDRHFRVHDLQDNELVHEEYMKIQTPVMLMRHMLTMTYAKDETSDEEFKYSESESNSDDDKKRKISPEPPRKKLKSKKLKCSD